MSRRSPTGPSPSRPISRRRLLGASIGGMLGAPSGPAAGAGSPRSPAGQAPLAEPQPFVFALIGDLPYSERDALRAAAMIEQLDANPLAFVLHVGDIKGGREPCSDALLAVRRDLLARSAHPLVLLPGDNEWTDCHRSAAGAYDPRERLAALRTLFWSTPGPLGRAPAERSAALLLERQPGAPENVVWRIGRVRFVALHVVGSNNGIDAYPGSRTEFEARERLNQTWLDAAVKRALDEGADALVIAAHANPGFGSTRKRGFRGFLSALQDAAERFPRPILYLHGDSHRFRVDQPLEGRDGRRVAHFTRIECFGYPFTSSWVQITYDPTLAERFHVGIREVG